MKKKFINSILTLLLILPIPLIILTLFPSYTVSTDVDITVWAYRKQSKKTGFGKIEEIHSVKRIFSLFDFIYNIKNIWTMKRKYPNTENIETHNATFSINACLLSNSLEINWNSSELIINHPGAYLATNQIIFRNLRPGNYSLKIILFIDNKIEDIYNSKIRIP